MPIKIPAKVQARFGQQLKRYQTIIQNARKRDINEADTALIVVDILCDVFGYTKIDEITSEHAVKTTFADLAIRVGNAMRFIVEVKSINTELKENHVNQVVNYAANLPVDWVILTNGARWQAYKVNFNKPIAGTLLLDVDLCTCSLKEQDVSDLFGGLSREVFTPDSMSQMFKSKQAMSKYSIAQLLLSDPVVGMVRRELRKLADGLNPNLDEVRNLIEEHVIKRELIEADDAKAAAKAVRKLSKKNKTKNELVEPVPTTAPISEPAAS
jgi:hypothetical protein